MRKFLVLGLFTVLLLSVFTTILYAEDTPTPNPDNFIVYKSPKGLFEIAIPKGVPLLKEHKEGVLYGSPEVDMIIAAGVKLFGEGDDVKVDMEYLKKQVDQAAKDIVEKGNGKIVDRPKKYKNGLSLLAETSEPPFPSKQKTEGEKKQYYFTMYVTIKNEKSLALIVYLPKDKYAGYKKTIDYMIDSLK